jgi:hypothetical protein
MKIITGPNSQGLKELGDVTSIWKKRSSNYVLAASSNLGE